MADLQVIKEKVADRRPKADKWNTDGTHKNKRSKKPSLPLQACHLISPEHEEEFPPEVPYQDMTTRTSYRQTIPDPSPHSQVTPAEACLNWSNTNAGAQNKVLKRIEHKQNQTESRLEILHDLIRQIHERMKHIEAELLAIVQRTSDMAATADIIRTKEKERKSLQYQLSSIQTEVHALSNTPPSIPEAFPWTHKPRYSPSYQPQPLLPPSLVTKRSSQEFQPLLPPSLVTEPPSPVFQEWRPKATLPKVAPMPKLTLLPETITVPPSRPARPDMASQKGKQPMHPSKPPPEYEPVPEYIPDLTEGAFTRLPDDFLPIEEPNPISSFLRAAALKESDHWEGGTFSSEKKGTESILWRKHKRVNKLKGDEEGCEEYQREDIRRNCHKRVNKLKGDEEGCEEYQREDIRRNCEGKLDYHGEELTEGERDDWSKRSKTQDNFSEIFLFLFSLTRSASNIAEGSVADRGPKAEKVADRRPKADKWNTDGTHKNKR
ncbi:hypothetical protein ACLOJK_009157 [Asimina triloba]